MSFRRWINARVSLLYGRSVRGQKPTLPRNRSRLGIERLEERLPPAAGLTSANQQLVSACGQLPLSFEANDGQTASQVQYLTQGSGYSLFLTSSGAVLSLTQSEPDALARDSANSLANASGSETTTGVALALNLVGANPNAAVTGLDQLPGTSNYFIGNDPSQWHTNIPNFSKVEYQNVYPGINLVYYGNQQQLEYDYQVAPGADPSSIRFAVQGADSVTLDAQGNLVLHTATGDVLEHAPVIYQQVGGVQKPVSGQFVLLGDNEVGFQVGAYDATLPLVIDPVLSYSTYLGGNAGDSGLAIAVDGSGNAYVTGHATSTNFPTTTGAFQTSGGGGCVFVTKLNASGTGLVYSTFLGSSGYGTGIGVDGSGNAYVTGYTGSASFPTTAGAFQTTQPGSTLHNDGFVTKLNASGTSLVYSTYLGGSSPGAVAWGIAVDGSGNAYVTGKTSSTFPTTAGAFQTSHANDGGTDDAFVTKLNASGTALVYSTYLGGNGFDYGYGIAVDGSGNAYVTGETASTNFPTTTGAFQTSHASDGGTYDAFVTKLNASGTALVYSTYLGGNGSDYGYDIAVDGSGNAYVTGQTASTNFPTTAGAFQTIYGAGASNAFVTKLNASGTALVYSTYLGGNAGDNGNGIAVDGWGNAYVTGQTASTNFPTTADAFQISHASDGGAGDAFVTKLNASGTGLIYSTYLGGSYMGSSGNDYGEAITVDGSGNAYVTGRTGSLNFPTTAGAFQTSLGGFGAGFVAKFSIGTPTVTSITPPTGSTTGDTVVTITGTNFTNATAVMFGSTAAAIFSINSDTQITATSPVETTGVVDVTVVTAGGTSATSSADQFTFTPSIIVTSKTVNGDLLNVTSTITSVSETGNSVQVTTSAADGFYVGELVAINGVATTGFNGTYAVVSVIDSTDFTYTDPTADLGISNGGTAVNALAGAQRSMVDSITYQFNQAVTLGAGAISMDVNSGYTGTAGSLPDTISYNTIDDGHTWLVTFSGSTVTGNSIADGVYDITLNASAVTADVGSAALAASQTDTFFRLFGDSNGDASVTSRPDVQNFAAAFGTSSTSSAYLAYFDYDADGSITGRPDVENFASRFGTSLTGFTATI